jgi:oligopeptidase B
MVHRAGLGLPAPMLLYGYGAYESVVDPWFSHARISLLDRGVIFAVAHVRGGGEMGRLWYENGKMAGKINTFTDFVACADHLTAAGLTDSEHLMARGKSAGGLLMGAVANLGADRFTGIVAEVPFVDVVNTMADPSIPLTVIEWEEWGNPEDPEQYRWLRGYSPYENLSDVDYPAILATAGLNDPRVAYWEPAKWVAKLRTNPNQQRPILLKTELGAGHGGPSGRYDAWKEEAFILAFILDRLGASK